MDVTKEEREHVLYNQSEPVISSQESSPTVSMPPPVSITVEDHVEEVVLRKNPRRRTTNSAHRSLGKDIGMKVQAQEARKSSNLHESRSPPSEKRTPVTDKRAAFADAKDAKQSSSFRLPTFKSRRSRSLEPGQFIPIEKKRTRLHSANPNEKVESPGSESPRRKQTAGEWTGKRLSKNLAANNAPLHNLLAVERAPNSPVNETNDTANIWTSKPFEKLPWNEKNDNNANQVPLISRECRTSGYHIEVPRFRLSDDRTIVDADKDFMGLKQLIEMKTSYRHYYAEIADGHAILTVESDSSRRFQRFLLRLPHGDHRLLILSANWNKMLKSLVEKFPELESVKFHKVKPDENLDKQLLDFESKQTEKTYKIGVLYAKEGQSTEDEYFCNNDQSPQFDEFLEFIGKKITLEGWQNFKGGLDVRTNATGTHSVFEEFRGFQIMFHVSTLIPFTPLDPQQVERKRHLGNDMVVIIFKEGGTLFNPTCIRSQFNHVFAVVQPAKLVGRTHYQIEWCAKPGVPAFGPYEGMPSIYEKSEDLKERFLTKLINAQRTSMYAPDFRQKTIRTRKMLLKELVNEIKS